ncbi:hypothetical protein HAX54_006178 [Datura stramonium]|uniref:Uncharacterized protein n=1 Tax=Datura stramonium TaxID=4076 RepID=A0ABS8T9W9_DATST|nr:hypothetical protein [Datura stramonium]
MSSLGVTTIKIKIFLQWWLYLAEEDEDQKEIFKYFLSSPMEDVRFFPFQVSFTCDGIGGSPIAICESLVAFLCDPVKLHVTSQQSSAPFGDGTSRLPVVVVHQTCGCLRLTSVLPVSFSGVPIFF